MGIGIRGVRIVDSNMEDVDIASLLGAGGATAISDGRKVVATTDTAIAIGSATSKVIFITALVGNSDVIVIGGSGVVFTEATRTGKVMYPGDAITVAVDNLGDVYINGTKDDGVSFSYTT